MTIAHSVLSVSFGRKIRRPAAEQIHHVAVGPAAPSLAGMTCSPGKACMSRAWPRALGEAAAPNPELPVNRSTWALATGAPTSKKVAVVKTRPLSVTRTNAEGSTLIEKVCDSSLEAGECFFCTGPETD
jgi:hypothetical protein